MKYVIGAVAGGAAVFVAGVVWLAWYFKDLMR